MIPYGESGLRRRLLGRRVALGGAVDRRRRREDDLDAVARGRLEDALRREHVPAQVEREDVAEAAHAGLPGEVEDAVEAREVELVLGQVDALNLDATSSRARVLLLQRRVVVVGEAVEPDDVVTGGRAAPRRGATR